MKMKDESVFTFIQSKVNVYYSGCEYSFDFSFGKRELLWYQIFLKLKKSDFESEMAYFISHIIYLPRFCTSIKSKE